MTRARPHEEVLDEDLKDPAEAAAYLSACLLDDDPEIFLLALRDVPRARGGVAKLAEMTELNREHLYRMLSDEGQPRASQPGGTAGRTGTPAGRDPEGGELRQAR